MGERKNITNQRALPVQLNAGREGGGAHASATNVLPGPRRCVSILGLWGNTIMHAKVPIHICIYNYLLITYSNVLNFLLFDR